MVGRPGQGAGGREAEFSLYVLHALKDSNSALCVLFGNGPSHWWHESLPKFSAGSCPAVAGPQLRPCPHRDAGPCTDPCAVCSDGPGVGVPAVASSATLGKSLPSGNCSFLPCEVGAPGSHTHSPRKAGGSGWGAPVEVSDCEPCPRRYRGAGRGPTAGVHQAEAAEGATCEGTGPWPSARGETAGRADCGLIALPPRARR